ncbi:antitoxin Xre-like helix-turn-helix domain-containing protein [Halomonas sp. BMC6]|uniref:antitoxin Xre-like helix-turn-helix domain-containing protein n=1 Tax=Halomonas sp. BMC6 TaxID=3073244 RepID=UPI0030D36F84
MPQDNDSQSPNTKGDTRRPIERLKGSVQHYDKPFEPVGIDNWEADILEPKNAVRPGEVPAHIAPTGTRYVRIREVPQKLQDSFVRYLKGAGCPVVDNEDGPLAFETDWIEWRQHRRPDRMAAHNSAETSAAVMRTFPNIAHEWELSDTGMATLLGLSSNVYREWAATPLQAHLTAEQLERASNLLGIYRSLTLLFPQVEHQQRWLHHLNDNAPFDGLSPMQLMHRGGLGALRALRAYLDAQRQGGFA